MTTTSPSRKTSPAVEERKPAEFEVREISHFYSSRSPDGQSVQALDNVSYLGRPGSFTVIVGASGCGKSTLLYILAGLITPTAGEVLVDGQVKRRPGHDRGMVFQEYAVFPWMTVKANVAFGLKLRGRGKEEREKVAQYYTELVGLSEFADAYPNTLSGGMRQRVAVARALANDPSVLLMDEPFAAVDAQTRKVLQEQLSRICALAGTTTVFVTHSIEEALLLGDRIVVMSARPGRIAKVVENPLPQPRTWASFAHDEKFAAKVEWIAQVIAGESVPEWEQIA